MSDPFTVAGSIEIWQERLQGWHICPRGDKWIAYRKRINRPHSEIVADTFVDAVLMAEEEQSQDE